jgi:Tat protein secretion system quality control protein TatD with DNase activity
VIDSHTHLDSCAPPNDELVRAAVDAGVNRILTVGMDGESCRSALAAAEAFPEVFAAIGRHPNSAEGFDECLAEGWWISFAGNVTYPKAQDLAGAAERVPDDRLLVETDAPYLTPQVVRKECNQPAYVAHTARFVAERRGMDYAELERVVERNAAGLFGW